VIVDPDLKILTPASRQAYLYEAGRRRAPWASRLKMSRPKLKKANHFYSFLLISPHFYSFLLIFATAIFRHDKPPFQKTLSFLIMAYYFLSNLIILKCMKESILQNVWAFCGFGYWFYPNGNQRLRKNTLPFYSLLAGYLHPLGNKVAVKTCMHLYAFVIICYGMYAFVIHALVS